MPRFGTVLSHVISKLQTLSTKGEAEQTQAIITKAGLSNHPSLLPKLISFASLPHSGCSLSHALMLFQETAMDDPFVCNTIIRAFAGSVFPLKAITLYNRMHRNGVKFDHFTYNFALKACARVPFCKEEDANCDGFRVDVKGAEIHCRVLKDGVNQDHYIGTSLVYLYAQCGLLGRARNLFDEMSERTIASWNIMISAYYRIDDFASADSLLESMPRKNVASWNTLIARYIRTGDIEAAQRIFETMPERDSVSWNSMIAGYVHIKDFAGALSIFGQMQVAGVGATEITLTSVLGACAETGALEIGRQIHYFLKHNQYNIEGYLAGALVDMYAKCGSMGSAWEVFNELKTKHLTCWNAMIVGLAVHGHCEAALELFSTMETMPDEVRPSRVTFIGVLVACRHNGLVEEGRRLFRRMVNEYKISPDIKHYGCMVDLLGRWGFLDEAHQMIKTMPFRANPVLWRTLLGACKVHGSVELAEESFQQLAKFGALEDGDYVLLANTYSEAGRWNDVERIRGEMIYLGVIKFPGSSNIDMKHA